MIVLAAPPAAALSALLRRPDGFSWWYADLTTPGGDGLVLIWSLGLPFLPTQAWTTAPAALRPALSLAVYRGGRSEFYLLQDYGQACSPGLLGADVLGSGRLGSTTFESSGSREGVELRVQLDEAVPRSRERLTGSIVVSGPACRTVEDESEAQHLWVPRVLHGTARASLRLGERHIVLEGAGYFDSNFSRVPLQRQGISRWLWGRVAFPDRTFTYYRTEGEDGSLATRILWQSAREQGEAEDPGLNVADVRRGAFGVRSPRRLSLDLRDAQLTLELGKPVDDGPFYQRFLVRGRDSQGQVGHGIAEVVVPGSLDRPWQRPFIRMRTHVVNGRNSLWLPLFSGFRQGRFRRLVGTWAS